MRKIEVISISILISGSIVFAVLGAFFKFSNEAFLSITTGLIASLGIYLLTANKIVENRLKVLETKQLPFSCEVTQEDWYKDLLSDVLSAKVQIQITHHSNVIPTEGSTCIRKKLWQTLVEKMGNQHILFRWIVAIHDEKKLKWVISLIEKYKTNDNLHINFSPIDLGYHAPPQSIQIIDSKKTYAIDMAKGQYIKSSLGCGFTSSDPYIISQFQRYYDTYWDRTIKLKEGIVLYKENIEELERKIKNI